MIPGHIYTNRYILAMRPPAYGARLLLAPQGPLRLPPASFEFSDGARHPFARHIQTSAERESAGASGAL